MSAHLDGTSTRGVGAHARLSSRRSLRALSTRRWLLALAGAYVLGLHAVVGVLVIKFDVLERLQRRLGLESQEEFGPAFWKGVLAAEKSDRRARPGSLVFIGDSIIRKLDTSSVADRTVNLSISGETTARLLHRIGDYRSLLTARGVVLGVGVNDLRFRSIDEIIVNFRSILTHIPSYVPVVVVGVLPVDERVRETIRSADTRRLNEGFAKACAERRRCGFVPPSSQLLDDAGNLRPEVHNGNGLHLSVLGHDLHWSAINAAVEHFVPPPDNSPPE